MVGRRGQRMTAPDPNQRQAAAAEVEASVWVAASAGTGKTKVLTDRVLALMLAGSAPSRILCLTFTKAAAAEMANRLNARLSNWATAQDGALTQDLGALTRTMPDAAMLDHARRLLARVLDTPGGMRIETIHAFCQSLLRRFPIEAAVAPHFEVMDERSAGEALAAAREEVLAAAQEGGALGESLAAVTRLVSESGFDGMMSLLTLARGRLCQVSLRLLHAGRQTLPGHCLEGPRCESARRRRRGRCRGRAPRRGEAAAQRRGTARGDIGAGPSRRRTAHRL